MEKEEFEKLVEKARRIQGIKSIIEFDKELYIFTEEPNVQKFKETLKESIDIREEFHVINVYHHNKELVKKLLRHGSILYGHIEPGKAHLGLKPCYLFSYDLTSLSQSDKVKISKRIHGSESNINGKQYKYTGLKDLPGNELVSNSTMIISNENYDGFKQFLASFKVKYTERRIWLE